MKLIFMKVIKYPESKKLITREILSLKNRAREERLQSHTMFLGFKMIWVNKNQEAEGLKERFMTTFTLGTYMQSQSL